LLIDREEGVVRSESSDSVVEAVAVLTEPASSLVESRDDYVRQRDIEGRNRAIHDAALVFHGESDAIRNGQHLGPASASRAVASHRAAARGPKLDGRRFGAEEAVGWSVGRQLIESGQGPPRSQPETRIPLRPDAIDRTVRPADRAPPPLSAETTAAERAHHWYIARVPRACPRRLGGGTL